MKVLKASAFLTLLFLLVAPAASLSCNIAPEKYTVHCPSSEVCEENFTIDTESEFGRDKQAGVSPDNLSENMTTRQIGRLDFQFQKVENKKLPSVEKALSDSKSVCPASSNFHLYSTEDFHKEGLKHRANCYETVIQEGENYYRVTREGTTEPWYCVRKHQESMISGGDKSWIAPIGTGKILTGAMWLYKFVI